ncbi:hypothetical protein ACLOJK_013799 [Asimina triloba]
MGKFENQTQIAETQIEIQHPPTECCSYTLARIGRVCSFRCVVVLALSACVFLSALFWLPPFQIHSGIHFPNAVDDSGFSLLGLKDAIIVVFPFVLRLYCFDGGLENRTWFDFATGLVLPDALGEECGHCRAIWVVVGTLGLSVVLGFWVSICSTVTTVRAM